MQRENGAALTYADGPQPLNILSAIGNTPMVELKNIGANPAVRILAKIEGCNPGGSVKDRPACYMIRHAEKTGMISPGRTILEPTSGNTGIALAMIGAALGYPVKLIMPACVSIERRRILEALGAEVVLSPQDQGTDGAILLARETLAREPDRYYMPNQFENEYNTLAHYMSTGPEILAQSGGRVDCLVAGMGTTGTLMGTGRYLKEQIPGIRIVGVEPPRGHAIQGLKNMQEAIVPGIYDCSMLDDKITVGDDEAFAAARLLAAKEGLFVGMSSGAAVAGAIHLAKRMKTGIIVTILPDRGERYLSTNLFRSFCAKCAP